jgi:hypothetical protein
VWYNIYKDYAIQNQLYLNGRNEHMPLYERILAAQSVLLGVAERTAMIPAPGLCGASQVLLKA